MRIAAVQCAPVFDDLDAAIAVVARHQRWAAERRVALLLFPEAFLLGHSYDPAVIARRAWQLADGGLRAFCRGVADVDVTIVIGGFAEADGGILNRAFVIENGAVIGHYDKAYPNEPGVTAGTAYPTFACSGVRYGINICADANHAKAAARVAAQGADLILFPLNNMLPAATAARWRARSMDNLVARAREAACWVASSDVVGASGDLVSHGCTAIVAPDGAIVARVAEDEPGVVVYDIPPKR